MGEKRTSHKQSREKIIPHGSSSQCKGPEAILSFSGGRNRTVASVAGAQRNSRGSQGLQWERSAAADPMGSVGLVRSPDAETEAPRGLVICPRSHI